MAEKKAKSLEELEQLVTDTQLGLASDKDLMALFEDEVPAAQPVQQAQPAPAVVEPQQAPATAQPASAEKPVEGEPNPLDFIPEKFRDKDVPTSVAKMSKSYDDLEAEFRRQRETVNKLEGLVRGLAETRPAAPQPVQVPAAQVEPEEEFDDASYLEKPKETITKTAQREAAKIVVTALKSYHEYKTRQQAVEDFRRAHSDMDQYRDEMLTVIKDRPDLDQNPNALPMIYELAKQKASNKLSTLRTSLGVPDNPPITHEEIQRLIDEGTKKKMAEFLEEVKKRKNASGTLGGGTPTPVIQRGQETSRETPLSPEDQLFQDMLASGPKVLKLED